MITNDFITKNTLTQDMEKVLNEHLKGKQFVYRSKYGSETIGEIMEVGVSLSITWDKESSDNFTNLVKRKSDRMHGRVPHNAPEPEMIPVVNPYSAYSFTIRIKSTNNITYHMGEDKIYILNDKS